MKLTPELDEKLLGICLNYDVDMGQVKGPRGNQLVCDARGAVAHAMTEAGMSRYQVGQYLNRTESAVAAMLGSHAIKLRDGGLSPLRAPGDPTDSEVNAERERKRNGMASYVVEEEEDPEPEATSDSDVSNDEAKQEDVDLDVPSFLRRPPRAAEPHTFRPQGERIDVDPNTAIDRLIKAFGTQEAEEDKRRQQLTDLFWLIDGMEDYSSTKEKKRQCQRIIWEMLGLPAPTETDPV